MAKAHVRLGLVENRHRIRQAVRNIKTFLARDTDDRSAQTSSGLDIMATTSLNLGIAGLGTVGAGVVRSPAGRTASF